MSSASTKRDSTLKFTEVPSPIGTQYPDSCLYRFPFTLLDKAYGRIEWHVEALRSPRKHRGMYWIDSLLVWATQTRDPRYASRIFRVPCHAEALHGESIPAKQGDAYFTHVWRAQYCTDHKALIFSAYPSDGHDIFEVDTHVSVGVGLHFRRSTR